ncbi:MAG TPA: hypothetical protein VJ792_00990 [Candidatus Nitrosotalea sp.]|nr:hypothetical protein [Candidatus Nitrosotalea sp.]
MLLESKQLVKDAKLIASSASDPLRFREEASVTSLIPVLFEMTKTVMRIRCSMARGEKAYKVQDLVSVLESSILRMAVDIEYLRKRDC